MYSRAAIEGEPGTGPSANSLVVLAPGIAKEKIIHGRLAASHCPKSAKQSIADRL
jgi:hypothetical protein